MDTDINDETWDAWNKLLDPPTLKKLAASRLGRSIRTGNVPAVHSDPSEDEQTLLGLYDLARELRDRLRYSQLRIGTLKAELDATQQHASEEILRVKQRAAAEVEVVRQQMQQRVQEVAADADVDRQVYEAKVAALHAELNRLRQGVSNQAQALDTQLSQSIVLQSEVAGLRAELEAVKNLKEATSARLAQVETELQSVQLSRDANSSRLAQTDSELLALKQRLAQTEAERVAWQERYDQAQAALTQSRSQATEALTRYAGLQEEISRKDNNMQAKVQSLSEQVYQSERRAAELADALMAAKASESHSAQVERLYLSTKDELSRLVCENQQLRDMLATSQTHLSTSNILDLSGRAMSPGRGDKSIPLHMSPAAMGKKKSVTTGHKASNAEQHHLDRRLRSLSIARDVLIAYSDDEGVVVKDASRCVRSPGRSRPVPAGGQGSLPASMNTSTRAGNATRPVSVLPEMSWVGPPASTYPAGSDQFEYERIAGGYSPRLVKPFSSQTARTSGWIPTQLVRLLQAFKHTNQMDAPDWSEWEVLGMMIDELYRAMKKNNKSSKAKMSTSIPSSPGLINGSGAVSPAPYPTVVQAAHIAYLKDRVADLHNQLMGAGLSKAATPKTHRAGNAASMYGAAMATPSAAGVFMNSGPGVSGGDTAMSDDVLKNMARKEYHMMQQLNEAVDRVAQFKNM